MRHVCNLRAAPKGTMQRAVSQQKQVFGLLQAHTMWKRGPTPDCEHLFYGFVLCFRIITPLVEFFRCHRVWSSYFLSLSQMLVEEAWAPLWAGEGLWLARLGDWDGLWLSLSPRRWPPLLRHPRLEPSPFRELERDLTERKKSWDHYWVCDLNT